MEISTRNVSSALRVALLIMKEYGIEGDSRNGKVKYLPQPVTLTLDHPRERVLFYPGRNENPFFHLIESLWMLDGRNDVEFLAQFNPRMREYSDDGMTLRGAYGYRWRNHFQMDQIGRALALLEREPNTRRAVIAMWDPYMDLGADSEDIPCNTHIYFSIRGACLDMTVCNRSNDLIWGMLGANAVHMTVLQEYMALRLDKVVGKYRVFTNNLHVYTEFGPGKKLMSQPIPKGYDDFYDGYDPIPIWDGTSDFFAELARLLSPGREPYYRYKNPFFHSVVWPMIRAWENRDDTELALRHVHDIRDVEWNRACSDYITRTAK